MTRDHTTIEELLAVQALAGLDGDDVQTLAAERASHGDCEECARLEAEFSATVGRLAAYPGAPNVVPGGLARTDAGRRRHGRSHPGRVPRLSCRGA